LGGKPPYGYHWKDKKLVPHPIEAPIRKLIYELYREHRRKKTVAQALNERGYRTRSGKKYSAKVLEDLIRDPTAKGLHRANYSTRRNNGKHEIKSEDEWVFTACEPIVSEELWEECNRVLMAQKSPARMPGPRPEHLFGGKVRCTCGNKMYARKQTGKYTCDKCNMKIPAADLEAIYHSQLQGFLLSETDLAAYLDRADEATTEKEKLIEVRTEERERVKREIDQLFNLYFAGEIPKEGFGLKYNQIEVRQKHIHTELLDLQVPIDVARIAKVNRDYMLAEARALHSRWPELSQEDKRDIVQAITDEIVVGKEEVEIHLQYLPGPGNRDDKGTYQVGFWGLRGSRQVALMET
ncbi:MAG: recombinase family protein, partial [Alphaproteobacteria bacterium]